MSNKEINMVQISGNLGQAPEYRGDLGKGGRATFSLAHSRYVPTLEGDTNFIKRTFWFRCVCWGKLATIASRLPKGAHIEVTGRLESRDWQDASGQRHSGVEIIVEQLEQREAPAQLETKPSKEYLSSTGKKRVTQGQNHRS